MGNNFDPTRSFPTRIDAMRLSLLETASSPVSHFPRRLRRTLLGGTVFACSLIGSDWLNGDGSLATPGRRLIADEKTTANSSGAGAEATVAGRNAREWASRLDDPTPELRRAAAANLAALGPNAVAELLGATRHRDADVRYWAFRGLRQINNDSTRNDRATRDTIVAATKAFEDESLAVRIVAASLLIARGKTETALPVLVAGLTAPQGGTRILAITELARLPKLDDATLAAIRQARDAEEQNEYVVRIAKRLTGQPDE